MRTHRRSATLSSPTGGYVVVGLLDADEEAWPFLLEALADGGYVPVDVNGHERPRELLDIVNGRCPVIHESLVRAPEFDTTTMVGFRTEWRPIGGGQPITLLSLTPREHLARFVDLAHEARGV